MITTILSGLALLVVTADLILTVREKKRGEERNAAFEAWKDSARDTILHYIDSEIECVTKKHDVFVEKIQAEMQSIRESVDFWAEDVKRLEDDLEELDNSFTEYMAHENERKVLDSEQKNALEEKLSDIQKRLSDLEHGVVPDYSEALAAKNAVDEFSRGLSSILNYDPVDAYRKEQERRKYGVEVE